MKLPLSIIQDPQVRQILQQIQNEYNSNPLNRGTIKPFTITESGVVTNKSFFHGLGIVPSDVIITRLKGASITFDFDSATNETIRYTTTGASEAHILLGRFD
jgi:hypothetical protein